MAKEYKWDVFVSHNHKDKQWVRDSVDEWRSLGLKVFFDEDSIEPGEVLVTAIGEAIESSKHVVFILSPASTVSRWVAMETSITILNEEDRLERKLIPVMLEPTEALSVEPAIRRLKWVNLSDTSNYQREYMHLLRVLGIDDGVSQSENTQNILHTSVQISTLLRNEDINNFIDFLQSDLMKKSLRTHLEVVRRLELETAQNEDEYLFSRKKLFSEIKKDVQEIFSAIKDYLRGSVGSGSILIAHEIGKVLTDNRQLPQGYELLSALEPHVRDLERTIGKQLYLKILDSIGEAARFSDDFDQADRLYREVLKNDRNHYFSLKHLATICRIKNDYLLAEKHFRKALDVNRSYHVLFSLGYLYHDFNDYDKARSFYKECVEKLDEKGIVDFYRVYLKLAYIQIIQRDNPPPFNYLAKVVGITKDSKSQEPFLRISCFTAHLLMALLYKKKLARVDSITYCKNYVTKDIDGVTHAVFYCVYNDLRRVFASRPDLLPTNQDALSQDEKEDLIIVLSKLERKHVQLQAIQAHKYQSTFPPDHSTLVILLNLFRSPSKGSDQVTESIRSFDTVTELSVISSESKKSFYLSRDLIGKKESAIENLKHEFDLFFDHGAFFLGHVSDFLALSHPEKQMQSYTAIMPQKIREECFVDYFYIDLNLSHDKPLCRVVSKKLICFDHTGRNRIFINPVVGCQKNCVYCYLPEYGIPNSENLITRGVSGAEFRQAIESPVKVSSDMSFVKGRDGTLLSIGSFCDPFLPEVAPLTLEIVEAISELGNPIQIATKFYPGHEVADKLANIVRNQALPLVINLSSPELTTRTKHMLYDWLKHSGDIGFSIYIKPFLTTTQQYVDEFISLSREYPKIPFIVGSFYVGENILKRLKSSSFEADRCYRKDRSGHLISPVISESLTPGYSHVNEESFCKQLQKKLNKEGVQVFRTASCALSSKYRIRDPLNNYKDVFCIGKICTNYEVCV